MNVYGDTTGTALLTEPEIAEFREETVPAMLAILAEKDLPETDPVEHLVALAPGLDQPRGPQLGQMLGNPGCRFAHRLGELVDRPLPRRAHSRRNRMVSASIQRTSTAMSTCSGSGVECRCESWPRLEALDAA